MIIRGNVPKIPLLAQISENHSISLVITGLLLFMQIIFDGKFEAAETPLVTSGNRGFRYGEGIFETIRVIRGRIRLSEYHFDRLFQGLALLGFEISGFFTRSYLAEKILELCLINQLPETSARVRLMVFRGDLAADGSLDPFPHFIIESAPPPFLPGGTPKTGLRLDIYQDGRKSRDAFSNLKSNNYLLSSMAAHHARKYQLDDSLILNSADRICESSIANLFCIREQVIYTPPLSEGCVAGVMRRFLLDQKHRLPFPLLEKEISPAFIKSAEEIFLTNAIQGIRPVLQFGQMGLSQKTTMQIQESLGEEFL